jgi:hypothetical protein
LLTEFDSIQIFIIILEKIAQIDKIRNGDLRMLQHYKIQLQICLDLGAKAEL